MSAEFPYVLYVEGKWDPKTSKLKNKLNIYFQSKKSNGGDCEVLYTTSDGQRATVRFKTEQVRKSVLEKQNHEIKLGRDLLTLTVYLPPDAESSQETETVVDTDRTDESPFKKIKKLCSSADPESEEGEKYEPASNDKSANQKMAVLENIQDMSKEFLVMLVENVLKEDDSKNFSIEVIPESKCAVITFANTQDAVNFIMCCPNNQIFKKKNLVIRPLEPTKKIQAENLPPNFNADHVSLYFDKYGETNGHIEMLEEHTAIITFEDFTDVEKVLKQEHQLKNHLIKVFPYYDSLETALYGKERPTLKLPEAFEERIDQFVSNYLQQQQSELNQIKQSMLDHFSEMNLQDQAVKISPASLILQQGVNTKKLIQTWRENASAAFTTLVSKYRSVSLPIEKDAWDKVKVEVHKALSSEPVVLIFPENVKTVVIAGLAKDVDRVGSVANNITTIITQGIQRVKGSMTDEIAITPSIYKITLLSGLQQEICNLFPELCLNYNDVTYNLTLTGLKHEVLESKNKILQAVISLKQKMVNLHPTILNFISKKDREEIIKLLFLSKSINASLDIKDNHILVFGKTEKALKESEDQLKYQLCYESFDIEDPNVTKKAEWHDLINNVNAQFNSSVQRCIINTSDKLVEIAGLIDSVSKVHKQLFDFVCDNSHAETILRAKKISVNFIKDNEQEWIEQIKGKTNVDFKDGTISLRGTRKYVNECKPVFEQLLSSVYSCNFKVNLPGAKKLFRTKEFMFVATVKSNTGCIVELTDSLELSKAGSITGKNTVITPNGLEIIVNKGNMCNYAVDAVVNAANEKLQLTKGLSKALADAAGPQLQDACNQIIKMKTQLNTGDAVLTEAGQLNFKYVIHAVGPQYDQSNSQTPIDLLKKAVKQSMELANEKNCLSIAIPAISSGSLGFPLDLCADCIVLALKEFCETSIGKPSIKEVHLIDINDKTIKAFEVAVQKVYKCSPKGKTLKETFKLLNKPKQNQSTSTKQASSSSFTTNEGLKINLLKCNIQDTAADVVVNSIQSDLSLTHGAIPNAIFSAAGSQLQTLLNQQATAPANTGAVFVTSGCNLKNKLVFHAVVTHYKQGQGSEKMLEDVLEKCLGEAEKQKQGSIVFPAIGTGQLGFPKQLVASLMLDSVINFSKNRTSSHVKEVMIALYPNDHPTIQAFTDEFNQKLNIQSSSANISCKGPFSKIISKSGTYETTVGGVVLQAVTGDITKESTDVIVNSSNEAFTLKIGVSKAILDAAGSNVEDECKQLGSQKNEGLVMTQQGNLQCKKIIHVSAKSSPPMIHKRVYQALQMSAKQKYTSIAFPAFGTGQGGVNPIQVADAMLDAVADFVSQTPQSSIKLVRVVIFQAPMLADFHQSMLKREGTQPMGLFSKLLKSFSKPPVPETRDKNVQQPEETEFIIGENVEDALFSICGSSQVAVDEAKQLLEKMIKDELGTESITDPMILKLSDKYKQRIEELQQSNKVSVKLKRTGNVNAETNDKEVTLTVEGLSKDILVVVREIQSMLKATREDVELKKKMERTSEWVDWQYQLGGKYQSFDQKINFFLEEAHEQNKTQVDITFQGQVHRVTMPEGPAVSIQNGSQMLIKRVDKIRAESFPAHWDSMASTDLYKVCPLQSNSTEYQDVLTHFKKTCQLNVLKIERIQNPGQWKNYQTTKQVMEQKNKHQNNEKRLFHGTREDTILHINKNGFNRSYAGLNATAFGKGTYFALNANYSANNTYSVPNAQNQKHMYLCRVLTGDYTTGNSTMFAAPLKGTSTGDFFDTVVDNPNSPTIFVVFRDYQAYPEYLITFT